MAEQRRVGYEKMPARVVAANLADSLDLPYTDDKRGRPYVRLLSADACVLLEERAELRRLVRLAMIGALMVDPDAHEWRKAAMAVMGE